MATKAKKSVKRSSAKSSASDLYMDSTPISKSTGKKRQGLIGLITSIPRNVLVLLLTVLVLLGLIAWKFGGIFVPVMVNSQPVFGWEYYGELSKRFGQQTLDSLVTQKLLMQEAKKKGVSVSKSDIDERVTELEGQLAESGGIDQALSLSGMTRDDLNEQLEINLLVEKLVEDRVEVTSKEIDDKYAESKEQMGDITEEEAKKQIEGQIKSQKIQEEVANLITELRDAAKIN